MGSKARSEVLVVDDNARVLRSLEAPIRRAGLEPRLYNHFSEAVLAIETSDCAPVVSLIDVHLDHGESGFVVADKCARRFGALTKIVMMSGYKYGSMFGGDRIIVQKPFATSSLMRVIAASSVEQALPAGALRATVSAFAERFSLMPQEARILAAMVSGTSRSRLALHLGLSENTVKSQVRSLLTKTTCENTHVLSLLVMSELARVV